MNAKAMGKNSKRNAPNPSCNKSGAAKCLPGYEQCNGCGLIRPSERCQIHAIKEGKIREGKHDEITCNIHAQLLTLQFLRSKAHPLVMWEPEYKSEDEND